MYKNVTKKLLFGLIVLPTSFLITSCGGGSVGSGGNSGNSGNSDNGGNGNAELPTCGSSSFDINIAMNEQAEQCLDKNNNTLDFVVMSSDINADRVWNASNVSAAFSVHDDATFQNVDCVYASGDVANPEGDWMLNFSDQSSCTIAVSMKDTLSEDNQNKVFYTLRRLYGVRDVADLKTTFFYSTADSFVLTQNIQLTNEQSAYLIPTFKGQLDGSGHTISDISMIGTTGISGTKNVGIIRWIELGPIDATVVIKNLTLEIKKLVGYEDVGGLIGQVSGLGNKAVQISNVTVQFAKGAEIQCTHRCSSLVGGASTAVNFSGIRVDGNLKVSEWANSFGGVVGSINTDDSKPYYVTDIVSRLNVDLSHLDSNMDGFGLVAGTLYGAVIKNIDVFGTVTMRKNDAAVATRTPYRGFGGVVGYSNGNTYSQVKSIFAAEIEIDNSNVGQIGGIVGCSVDDNITNVYGKLSSSAHEVFSVGGVVGCLQEGTLLTNAVGYLDAKMKKNDNNDIGGLVGKISDGPTLSNVFAVASIVQPNAEVVNFGQMVGMVDSANDNAYTFQAKNCYNGSLFSITLIDELVSWGNIADYIQPEFADCYTRAQKFVPDSMFERSNITFNNVYAKNAQTDENKEIQELPNEFTVKNFVPATPEQWTNQYNGQTYKHLMLAYPSDMAADSVVTQKDWFEYQIIGNDTVR